MTGPSHARPSWNPYIAGIVLGTVLFLSYALTGSGLGASGGLARIVTWGVDTAAPAYVDRHPALAPMAGGDRSPLSHRMVWLVAGVAVGGFVSGLLGGRCRVATQKGPRPSRAARWGLAVAGGVIAGYGAQVARGCTSGQALSGGATLAAGSWCFMFAVFGGGYLLAYPLRRLWL